MQRKPIRIAGSLALAAGLGAAGAAGAASTLDDWDYSPLYDDWRLSKVLDGEVYTASGIETGDVEDIVIGPEGLVQSVIIRSGGELGEGSELYEAEWSQVDFNPLLGSVTLDATFEDVEAIPKVESVSAAIESDQWSAENLIGMQASVDGSEPYGEVSDILVTPSTNVYSAFVIEPDGMETDAYAIPADFGMIDRESGVLKIPYSEEELDLLETLNLDEIGLN